LIVDSSALLALVFREPGYERVLAAVAAADWVGVGAPTLAETGIVLSARISEEAKPTLALLLRPRGESGRHPAALDFGDCLTYAAARVAGMPLLFVGDDFARTDLEPVLR
jgi:ribonuclease VapC